METANITMLLLGFLIGYYSKTHIDKLANKNNNDDPINNSHELER